MKKPTYQRIAVLMGGRSAEREVSLSSGRGVIAALAAEGFDPVGVDPGYDQAAQLRAVCPDAVFNALHGRFGEDGTVQGILEWMRLPYTHSGVLASALAMHKERTKDIYRAAGLPVVKSIVADRLEAARGHLMEPPYVVKPVNEGSSVGIFIVRKGDNRPPAALAASDWTISSEMMIEEFVPGRELTVSVMAEITDSFIAPLPRPAICRWPFHRHACHAHRCVPSANSQRHGVFMTAPDVSWPWTTNVQAFCR